MNHLTSHPPDARHRGRARLPLLTLALVVAACACTMLAWRTPATGWFWMWCAICFASERLWLRLPLGDATITMASCCNAAAILLMPPGHAMAAIAVSTLLAELVFMHKPPMRALYNGAQSALAAGAAGCTLVALRPWVGDVVAPIVGLSAYWLVNTGAVSLAIAWHDGLSVPHVWRTNFGHRYEIIATGALFSIGSLVAGHMRDHGPSALLLALLPMLAAWEGWRYFLTRRAVAARDERLREVA